MLDIMRKQAKVMKVALIMHTHSLRQVQRSNLGNITLRLLKATIISGYNLLDCSIWQVLNIVVVDTNKLYIEKKQDKQYLAGT